VRRRPALRGFLWLGSQSFARNLDQAVAPGRRESGCAGIRHPDIDSARRRRRRCRNRDAAGQGRVIAIRDSNGGVNHVSRRWSRGCSSCSAYSTKNGAELSRIAARLRAGDRRGAVSTGLEPPPHLKDLRPKDLHPVTCGGPRAKSNVSLSGEAASPTQASGSIMRKEYHRPGRAICHDRVPTKDCRCIGRALLARGVGVRSLTPEGYRRRLGRHSSGGRAICQTGVDAIMVIGTSLTFYRGADLHHQLSEGARAHGLPAAHEPSGGRRAARLRGARIAVATAYADDVNDSSRPSSSRRASTAGARSFGLFGFGEPESKERGRYHRSPAPRFAQPSGGGLSAHLLRAACARWAWRHRWKSAWASRSRQHPGGVGPRCGSSADNARWRAGASPGANRPCD